MIQKVKVQTPIRVETKNGEPKQQWPHRIFLGQGNSQRTCATIIGMQNSGKTSLLCEMLNMFLDHKRSQLWWLSSLANDGVNLDQKVEDLKKKYNVQMFSQKDVDRGILKQLFDYLFKKKQQMSTRDKNRDKYWDNVIVLDDIMLGQQQQTDLSQIIKDYRHLRVCVFILSQSPVQQTFNQLREIIPTQILFSGITNKRLGLYYKELRSNLDKHVFESMYRICVEGRPHGFMVIDSRNGKTTIQCGFDTILRYLPPESSSSESESDSE